MTLYKCGHKSKPIFMSNSVVDMDSYLDWRTSTGYDGDKTECFKCYRKRINSERITNIIVRIV